MENVVFAAGFSYGHRERRAQRSPCAGRAGAVRAGRRIPDQPGGEATVAWRAPVVNDPKIVLPETTGNLDAVTHGKAICCSSIPRPAAAPPVRRSPTTHTPPARAAASAGLERQRLSIALTPFLFARREIPVSPLHAALFALGVTHWDRASSWVCGRLGGRVDLASANRPREPWAAGRHGWRPRRFLDALEVWAARGAPGRADGAEAPTPCPAVSDRRPGPGGPGGRQAISAAWPVVYGDIRTRSGRPAAGQVARRGLVVAENPHPIRRRRW